MRDLIESIVCNIESFLTAIEQMDRTKSFLVGKHYWSVENINDICESDFFDFGLAFIEHADEFELFAFENKTYAKIARNVLKGEKERSIVQGFRNTDKIREIISKVQNTIEKYFEETVEESAKTLEIENLDKMKLNRVIPKTYIQRKIAPYLYTNNIAKFNGMKPASVLEEVLFNMITDKKIIELTPLEKAPFNTKAKLYGVF